jgi:hypothetical protein
MGILDTCKINTCDSIKIDPITYCNIEKIDKSCSLVDLFDDNQCIGAAINTINVNFENIDNILTEIKQQSSVWLNILEVLDNKKEDWE